jgi:hypothetical protein
VYIEVGGELLRGGSFPAAGGEASSGTGVGVAAPVGGDVGRSHSWRAGVHILPWTRTTEFRPGRRRLAIPGDDVTIGDFVWVDEERQPADHASSFWRNTCTAGGRTLP